jgi:hypothetical protein
MESRKTTYMRQPWPTQLPMTGRANYLLNTPKSERFIMVKDMAASLNYFSRDSKFQLEKPYVTSFPVDGIQDAKVSNHENTAVEVFIRDLRGVATTPSLDKGGFCVVMAPTTPSYDDFNSRDKIRSVYFPELRKMLKALFPHYSKFAFFDFEVNSGPCDHPFD